MITILRVLACFRISTKPGGAVGPFVGTSGGAREGLGERGVCEGGEEERGGEGRVTEGGCGFR